MSKEDFDRFLVLLGGFLNLDRKQRQAISDELRDHLEMRVESLVRAGIDESAAQKQALEEFGDAAGIAARFATLAQQRNRRRMMRIASISTLLAIPMVICTILLWPESNNPRINAPAAVAQQENTDVNAVGSESKSASELVRSPRENVGVTSSNAKDLATEKVLDFVVSVEGGSTFQETLNKLYQQGGGLQFILHTSAEDTITYDTEIDERFNLRKVSLKSALDLLLERYECTFTIKDGMIVILSVDEAETAEQQVSRVFYVKKILDAMKKADVAKRWNAGGNLGSSSSGGGLFCLQDNKQFQAVSAAGMGGGSSDTKSPNGALNKKVTEVDVLCNAVQVMVLPDRWEANGGSGCMFLLGDSLAVRADYLTIRKVHSFLNDLRVNLGIEPE